MADVEVSTKCSVDECNREILPGEFRLSLEQEDGGPAVFCEACVKAAFESWAADADPSRH